MLVAAGLESKTPAEIADAYEAGFHEDEALVNILPAHVFPRATEHVPDMLALATRSRRSGMPTSRRPATSTTRSTRSPTTAACRATPSTACGRAIAGRRARQARPRPTSPCGRRPARAGSSAGRARGATASRAGTSSARRWPCATSGRASRSTPAASTTSSPTTRTRSRSRRRSRAVRRCATGSTASTCWRRAARWRSPTGNFERVTELRDRGIDPLAFRYLAADRPLRAQAQLLAAVDRGRGGGARLAAGAPRRAGTAAGRRPVGRAARAARRVRRPAPDRESPTVSPGTRPDPSLGARRPTIAARGSRGGRRAPLARRPGAPRPVRGRDRRRPRPADGARGRPRGAPAPTSPPTSAGGWCSTPISCSGWTSTASGRRTGFRPRATSLPAGAAALLEARGAARRRRDWTPRRRAARRARGAGDRGRRRRRTGTTWPGAATP